MASAAGDTEQELPTEEWLQFFDELGRCAVLEVALAGGEPLLREDLPQLIEGLMRNRMRYSLLSNGTLITEAIARFLATTKRCIQVQISLDGASAEIHEKSRGSNSFFRAVAGLQRLRKHQVPVAVRVTINHHNVDHLEEIAAFLLDEIGLPNVSTNSAGYMGLCQQHAETIQLSTEERSRAMAAMLRLSQRYKGRISAQAGPLAEARNWLEMEQARQAQQDPFPNGGFLRSCGGVRSDLGVRADGLMVPCSLMSHIALGRINRDNLARLWQTHPELMRLRRRVDIPLSQFESCRDCAYIPYCRGNCPATAYSLTGQENHPSPDGCLRLFLEDGGQLPATEGTG